MRHGKGGTGPGVPSSPSGTLAGETEDRTEGRWLWASGGTGESGRVEDLRRELFHPPCPLRPLGECRWAGWRVSGSQEVPRGWRKERGRQRLCPADPPGPGPAGPVCASLAPHTPLHMAVAGGWWLCLGALRLLPLPGEGAESRAEWVIIDSPVPGWPKPVPSIPGMTRSRSRSLGMGRAKQRQLGGGQWGRDSQLSHVLPLGSSGEAGPTSFSGSPAEGTGGGLVSSPKGVCHPMMSALSHPDLGEKSCHKLCRFTL